MKALVASFIAAIACGPVGSLGGDAANGRGDADAGRGPGTGSADAAPAGAADAAVGGNLDLYQSGSRIKMKVLRTPDGAKTFQGNYDSQRGEDCSFTYPTADGVMRCLPSIATLSYFSDAACTVPIALTFACSQPPPYVATLTQSCTNLFVYGPIHAAVPVSPTTYYGKSGTACVSLGTPSAQFAFFGISGPEIPPTSFQSATLSIE